MGFQIGWQVPFLLLWGRFTGCRAAAAVLCFSEFQTLLTIFLIIGDLSLGVSHSLRTILCGPLCKKRRTTNLLILLKWKGKDDGRLAAGILSVAQKVN